VTAFIGILRRLVLFIGGIGADRNDVEETRLQKGLLVSGSLMVILAGFLWGVLYVALGELLSGSIPILYSLISLLMIAIFAVTRRFRLLRFSQLFLMLLLPFLLLFTLGGFLNSGAVILWSLLSPIGALLFDEPRRAHRWLFAHLVLVLLSGLIQPFAPHPQPLPQSTITFFFVINISAVSMFTIVLLAYFVGQRNIFQEKSENLLYNILPREIAAILRDDNRTIADHFSEASVLFADMVDFTPMSAEMTPTEMVDLLNEIFTHFDGLVEKYDLEKIKTVGDYYMVAAGVPRPHTPCADHRPPGAGHAGVRQEQQVQCQPAGQFSDWGQFRSCPGRRGSGARNSSTTCGETLSTLPAAWKATALAARSRSRGIPMNRSRTNFSASRAASSTSRVRERWMSGM
jgi:guanylate cyclase